MYIDKVIKCKNCNEDFVFTAGEQEFYLEKGFDSEPTRCKKCRANHKFEKRQKTIMYEIVCSKCGKIESVPFEPRHDRPVFCGECYKAKKNMM